MATPADSDDEYLGQATGLNQDINNNVSSSGSSGSGGGVGGGEGARMTLVGDSRMERGLASPTLRGNASSPWDEH
jgi:sodium/hydrogen exchanger-like protein 6/7